MRLSSWLEQAIRDVCIDEWRGRRAAAAIGLQVTGSLGLLGRAKSLGASASALASKKEDEGASIGITVSPEQIPQYFGPPPDMASTVPARR